jgi:hypothetical protein
VKERKEKEKGRKDKKAKDSSNRSMIVGKRGVFKVS